MNDLDRDWVDLICWIGAALLLVFAQFQGVQDGPVYDFAKISAGAALRGFGTKKGD